MKEALERRLKRSAGYDSHDGAPLVGIQEKIIQKYESCLACAHYWRNSDNPQIRDIHLSNAKKTANFLVDEGFEHPLNGVLIRNGRKLRDQLSHQELVVRPPADPSLS